MNPSWKKWRHIWTPRILYLGLSPPPPYLNDYFHPQINNSRYYWKGGYRMIWFWFPRLIPFWTKSQSKITWDPKYAQTEETKYQHDKGLSLYFRHQYYVQGPKKWQNSRKLYHTQPCTINKNPNAITVSLLPFYDYYITLSSSFIIQPFPLCR